MIISNDGTRAWLEHRAGIRKLSRHPLPAFNRSLENSQGGKDFIGRFGHREINGVVGFVDLAGFSDRVARFAPSEVSEYLRPFLSGVIEKVIQAGGLVDKTIGDEVMLVLPDMEEDGGAAVDFDFQFLLVALNTLQIELGGAYPFHFGFAYGRMYIDRVGGNGYEEWSLAGRSVILAKRLSSLPASSGEIFRGVFGVLCEEIEEQRFESLTRFVAGELSPFAFEQLHAPPLKGIVSARAAAITRRG